MTANVSNPKINALVDTIVKKFDPEKVILFGSYAWGQPEKDSDVDLLVVKNTSLSWGERDRTIRDILWGSGIATDVLVYTPAELEKSIRISRNLFLEDIAKNGIVVYVKDAVRQPVAWPR